MNIAMERYDVCISFASENRCLVENMVNFLNCYEEIHLFYDELKIEQIVGKDETVLESIYNYNSRYCIVYISDQYSKKYWTNIEWKFIKRRLQIDSEYLIPIKVDDTIIQGMPPAVDLSAFNQFEAASTVLKKLGLQKEELPFVPAYLVFKNQTDFNVWSDDLDHKNGYPMFSVGSGGIAYDKVGTIRTYDCIEHPKDKRVAVKIGSNYKKHITDPNFINKLGSKKYKFEIFSEWDVARMGFIDQHTKKRIIRL